MDFKELNTKAWEIRREAAKRFDCKVTEISWKECLVKAKEDLQKEEVKEWRREEVKTAKTFRNIFCALAVLVLFLNPFMLNVPIEGIMFFLVAFPCLVIVSYSAHSDYKRYQMELELI